MTTMVGFDVAKNTVVAAIVNSSTTVLKTVTLTNTVADLQVWLSEQLTIHSQLAVCCESTSYYHYDLVRACGSLGLQCRVLNPIVTKQAIKTTIRGKKSDSSDAVLIARLGLQGAGTLTETAAIEQHAKTLLRASNKLQALSHSLQLMERSLVERQTPLPPAAVRSAHKAYTALQTTLEAYRDAACSSVSADVCELLCSIPGIGRQTAVVLVAEIGSITRFGSLDKLVAYAGLDPRIRQSGVSLHRNTRLTKRGSPSLRRAVFLAANVSRQYDPKIQAYYQKKRNEGRTHTEAMIPTCRQLLSRIYAVWRDQRFYIKKG